MPDFVYAFKRPFSDMRTAVTCFALGFLGAILFGLGLVLIKGFALQATNARLRGKKELPAFELQSIGKYFVSGLKVAFVELVYFFPGIVFLLIALGNAIVAFFTNTSDTIALSEAVVSSGFFVLIGAVLFAIGWVFSLMAITNMAEEEKLRAGFDIGKIIRKMFTAKFFTSLVMSIAYFFVLWFAFLLLSILSFGILGLVLAGGLFFYAYMTSTLTIMAETFLETN